tara:strand:- start:352 stop:1065 length:714 start_codon:yes stop_codon:yes gene_type:complete
MPNRHQLLNKGNMKRPAIPKRFAARIRAAQNKVTDAHYDITHDDREIAFDSERIAEYEADPKAFAQKYYGNNPVDSYPVQTNISRCKENLERRRSRRAERLDALKWAKKNLEDIEQQVLQEVNCMRQGTPGRVPWPDPPLDLEEIRRIEDEAMRRMEKNDEKKRLEIERDLEAEAIENERISQEEQAIVDKEWQMALEKMSPKERKKAKNAIKNIYDGLRFGEITPSQIIEYLKSRK